MKTAEEIKKILNTPLGVHPSKEDEFRIKKALLALADEIDSLKQDHTSGRV